jgi:hypothetical protein
MMKRIGEKKRNEGEGEYQGPGPGEELMCVFTC